MANATDHLIDQFASKLLALGVLIRRHDNTLSVQKLEAKLPKRLPLSFGSLLSRYSFPSFDAGGISFFDWESPDTEFFKIAPQPKNRCLSCCYLLGISKSAVLIPAGLTLYVST